MGTPDGSDDEAINMMNQHPKLEQRSFRCQSWQNFARLWLFWGEQPGVEFFRGFCARAFLDCEFVRPDSPKCRSASQKFVFYLKGFVGMRELESH
jgi:hypothetical protein